MSDDGAEALVIIGMIGAPFSPRYAEARAARAAVDPTQFSGLNVAVYGARSTAWALTERDRVARDERSLVFGQSRIDWSGDDLVVTLDERTAPFPGRIRGRVRVMPRVRLDDAIALDGEGLHLWRPMAPMARIEVALEEPRVRWSGHAYVDGNEGSCPLEESFRGWTWSRARLPSSRVALTYDTAPRAGAPVRVARVVDGRGRSEPLSLDVAPLPRTGWRLARTTRADAGCTPRIARSLEDTPFYARAMVDAAFGGERATAMHEVLSLDRFAAPWVRFLLPFRMRTERTGRAR